MNSESSRVVPKSAKFEFHSGTYISIDWGNLVCVVVVVISAKRDVLALVLVEEREHAEFFRLGVILTNVSVAGVASVARRLNKVIFPPKIYSSLYLLPCAADTPILRCSSRIIP